MTQGEFLAPSAPAPTPRPKARASNTKAWHRRMVFLLPLSLLIVALAVLGSGVRLPFLGASLEDQAAQTASDQFKALVKSEGSGACDPLSARALASIQNEFALQRRGKDLPAWAPTELEDPLNFCRNRIDSTPFRLGTLGLPVSSEDLSVGVPEQVLRRIRYEGRNVIPPKAFVPEPLTAQERVDRLLLAYRNRAQASALVEAIASASIQDVRLVYRRDGTPYEAWVISDGINLKELFKDLPGSPYSEAPLLIQSILKMEGGSWRVDSVYFYAGKVELAGFTDSWKPLGLGGKAMPQIVGAMAIDEPVEQLFEALDRS